MWNNLFSFNNRFKLFYLLVYAGGVSWIPIFSAYLRQNGMTGWQTGVLTGIYPFVVIFLLPLWGLLADQYGKQKIMLLGCLTVGISFLFFGSNQPFLTMLVITLGVTIFYGSIPVILDSIYLDFIDGTTRPYGKMRMWGALGWSGASWLMSAFVTSTDYLIYFKIAAAIYFLSILLILTLRKIQPKVKVEQPDYNMEAILNILKNRRLLLFLFIVFIHSLATTALWTHQGLLLEKLGASQRVMRMAFGIQGLFELPFFFFANSIIRKTGMMKALLFSIMAMIIRLLWYAYSPNAIITLYVETLQGISWALFWVCCVEFINKNVSAQFRTTGQSILAATYLGLGLISGNMITGILLDYMHIQKIFLCSAILLCGSIPFLFLFMLKRENENK